MDFATSENGDGHAVPLPAAVPVPLFDTRFRGEPAALYGELRREHGEVAPVLLDGGVPAWLVLGYRELHQVTSDPELFSRDSGLWNQWPNIPADWPLLPVISPEQPSVLGTVGERHRQRVALIDEALEAVEPLELRGHVERFADELIDVVCGVGAADLVGQFAALLPVRVLAFLFGFREEHGPGLVAALNDILDGRDRAMAAEGICGRRWPGWSRSAGSGPGTTWSPGSWRTRARTRSRSRR